jgi:hypothetical protein
VSEVSTVALTPVAVEKLFVAKFAKNEIASGCVISDLLGSHDIFYPPNFGRLGRKASFSQPRDITPTIGKAFQGATVGLLVTCNSTTLLIVELGWDRSLCRRKEESAWQRN